MIAAVIGGHLLAILSGRECWPFSNYPMYSGRARDYTLSMLRLFGVADEEAPREVPLLTGEYLWPFDSSRLRAVLGRLDSEADREARLGGALSDVLRRYEARRVESRHDGPPLRGIRLYRLSWRLDAWARNRDRPDPRALLFELVRPSRGEE
jgi:hypothetical protein